MTSSDLCYRILDFDGQATSHGLRRLTKRNILIAILSFHRYGLIRLDFGVKEEEVNLAENMYEVKG